MVKIREEQGRSACLYFDISCYRKAGELRYELPSLPERI